MQKQWYSIGNYNQIECGNCNKIQGNVVSMDHHSGECPDCKIECIWYDLGNGKGIQIISSNAPIEIQSFIKWSQKELDELEFLNLIIAFETLGNEVNTQNI